MVKKIIEAGEVVDKVPFIELVKENPVVTALVVVTSLLVVGFIFLAVKVKAKKKRK